MTGVGIISGIRQKVVVGTEGRIEILTANLPQGTVVEVIVLVEPVELDTTEYLLSTQANRQHLLQALEDLQDRSRYIYVNVDEL